MLNIIILAAGKGTRMKSSRPKVLHTLGGKPMIEHVIDKALRLRPQQIFLVIGHQSEVLRAHILSRYADAPIQMVLQEEQLGTAHAVGRCLPLLDAALTADPDGRLLILYGDVPLVCEHTLSAAIAHSANVVLTARLPNPQGYGRIVRQNPNSPTSFVDKIVEEKHLTDTQRAIAEINTGVLCVKNIDAQLFLDKIEQSSSGEFYLTDIVEIASRNHAAFVAQVVEVFYQFSGVNDPLQLAEMERYFQQEQVDDLLRQGVRMADPKRVDIRGSVVVGSDVFLDVGVILAGDIHLANGAQVGAYSILENVVVGERTHIHPFSHLSQCHIGADASIGPYARLRPGTKLADRVHVGNFVEVKNSVIGEGSKANHLAYVGDADIGARVNVGAGTITCNYDGVNKHRTTIEDDVFIGSDTQLVAPVTVHQGATLGAGTTLTHDAPAHTLTLSRAPQTTHPRWQRPIRKK